MRYYGLWRARREKWRLMSYPKAPAEVFRAFRMHGAVIVAEVEHPATHNASECREWWFGLPPIGMDVDLRELACKAGMLGAEPVTMRWYPPRGVPA